MKRVVVFSVLFTLAAMVAGQEIPRDSVKPYLMNAQLLFKKGQKQEASKICTAIMQNYPDNKDAVQWWLIMNMKRSPTGELEAVNMLDSLNKLYPKNTGLLFFKTFIQAENGQNEQALAGFDKLISSQPDSALNYIGKGQVLVALKKYPEAFVAFDKATSLDPKRVDVWGMKASTLAKVGKFDEAISALNQGIELAPGFADSFYNRACIFSLKGDRNKALADLRKAIEMQSSLKENAATDEDFKNLKDDQGFKELIK